MGCLCGVGGVGLAVHTLPNREEKVPVRREWKMMMVSSRSQINTLCRAITRTVCNANLMKVYVRETHTGKDKYSREVLTTPD